MAAKKRTNPTSVRQPTDDIPFTARLPDGRTLFALVPAKWCEVDTTGEVLFKPDAIRFLGRLQALAMQTPAAPTPGYIRTLRGALGLTQVELGEKIGVDSMTVSRWERGTVKPSEAAAKALDKLRRDAGRRGVVIAA